MRVLRLLLTLGVVLTLAACAGSTRSYPSPDGRFGAEVTRDTHTPQTVWRLVVQVGVTASVGSWTVGCLSEGAARDVVWDGPLAFTVTTAGGAQVAVSLDASGRARDIEPADAGLGPCPTS